VKRHLIIYAKRPLPNHAKTRLGHAIGEENAAGVYARVLYTYLQNLLTNDLGDVEIELSVTAPQEVDFFADAFPEVSVRAQIPGDLGQRIAHSFRQAFAQGASQVVLTGSDIPELDHRRVRAAFAALQDAPVVTGPACDGGYYLIGLRAPGAPLFDGITWSSAHVLTQTLALAEAQNLRVSLLPELYDIDTHDEFEHWRASILEKAGQR
jgi:rSAM/selenodomain-associated transferase 1